MADDPAPRIAPRRAVYPQIFEMTAIHAGLLLQLTLGRIVDGLTLAAKSARQCPHACKWPGAAPNEHDLQLPNRQRLGHRLPFPLRERKHDYISRNPVRCSIFLTAALRLLFMIRHFHHHNYYFDNFIMTYLFALSRYIDYILTGLCRSSPLTCPAALCFTASFM